MWAFEDKPNPTKVVCGKNTSKRIIACFFGKTEPVATVPPDQRCMLVPQGTPAILIPFIVCIETISNVIRPGTLAVRLTANIIAGHLLLTLLGNTGPSLSYAIISLLLIAQIALLMLESAVAIIQILLYFLPF